MFYEDVCKAISEHGEGTHEMSQKKLSYFTKIDIEGGICHGMVVGWLKSKKDGKDYWSYEKIKEISNSTPLLTFHKNTLVGKNDQKVYKEKLVSRKIMNEGTKILLGESKLKFKEEDSLKSEDTGFAGGGFYIANQIFSAESRYYILGIWGEKTGENETAGKKMGHAIGIYRKDDETAYVFDPNVGEFKVYGKEGVARMLLALYSRVYPRTKKKDWNKEYYLWSFN